MLDNNPVVLYDTGATSYPPAPFHPSERYPEYPFVGESSVGAAPNAVYATVRLMLRDLGLDSARFGTPDWNPLGQLVKPGSTVVIKPNLVISEHPLGQIGIDASVAHGAVIRPLVDYALLALKGEGEIVIADSPIKDVDFGRIIELTGVASIAEFYSVSAPIPVRLLDIRDRYVPRGESGFMEELIPLPGDSNGYTNVDLGHESMFDDVAGEWRKFRSTAVYYENVASGEFHNDEHHIYSVPNTLLNADLVIPVAKLKTHRKSGVTLSLKNAVGITNEKRALPHHRMGPPTRGGDSVADGARPDAVLEDRFRDITLSHSWGSVVLKLVGKPLRTFGRGVMRSLFSKIYRDKAPETLAVEGDWYGNDTVWRMAHDLNRALIFAGKDGKLQPTPQRNYLSFIDGVIAGEKEGPLYPTPVHSGVLLAGFHPVTVDLVATALMGFDYQKLAILREAVNRQWPLQPRVSPQEIEIIGNKPEWKDVLRGAPSPFRFEPSRGWVGHIEREDLPAEEDAA